MASAPGDREESNAWLEPLRDALSGVGETERYRRLARLLAVLADEGNRENGRPGSDRSKELAEKVQELDLERANLQDELKTVKADLQSAKTQLENERQRVQVRQETIDKNNERLTALKQEVQNLNAELSRKADQLYAAERRLEEVTLKSQRAQAAQPSSTRIDDLALEKRDLTVKIDELKKQLEQVRQDKDAEIESLKEELLQSRDAAAHGGDTLLVDLWKRLAAARPSLCESSEPPTTQTAERLVDGFVELVRFVNEFDQSIRPFLETATKDHASVRVPWEAYTRQDPLTVVAQRTVAPKGGRPVGVLKLRLRLLQSWTAAAMIANDSSLASTGSELETFLRGTEHGMGSNANKTLREFLRADGAAFFSQHMRDLRSEKLADAFGRGG